MDSIWNEIKRVADENSGFIKTSAVEAQVSADRAAANM